MGEIKKTHETKVIMGKAESGDLGSDVLPLFAIGVLKYKGVDTLGFVVNNTLAIQYMPLIESQLADVIDHIKDDLPLIIHMIKEDSSPEGGTSQA